MVFPVVMYGRESWSIKKAERRRIDAFELWCWGRLSRVPWTASRSNQSILKEISPGCSLERLMLKLKFQYFGHQMQRAASFEKTLMLGKIEGRRFTVQLSHPYMTTGKTIALTRWTFVGKVISLLFNMLSRLVITFLPRSKCLLISWLQSLSAVTLEPPKK